MIRRRGLANSMSSPALIRALSPGDEELLESFLTRHPDSSMFLRSNARGYGLRDEGDALQGTYVAGFEPAGAAPVMTGAAAHYRNGMLVLQTPEPGAAAALARRAVAESGREIGGLAGPWSQVVEARSGLGLDARPVAMESREDLFALDLADLRVPEPLAGGAVECRAPADPAEIERACAWRVAYHVEALGGELGPELEREAVDSVMRAIARGQLWLLVDRARGEPVSTTALNASLPDLVQIGGVYTPPGRRGRGHARSAVAGQLLDVRRRGARRAVLFTATDNEPARRAYQSIGFRVVGDYGLVLFAP
jgi:RimJ/RimL family protein N-acetyltransferase